MTTALPSVDDYRAAMREHAVAKRFFERWVADRTFRSELPGDPQGTLDRYGIDLSVDDIRSLMEPGTTGHSPAVVSLWRTVHEKTRWVERFYGSAVTPADARMASWRARQIERQRLDLGPYPTRSNIHASWCAELTKGCTGGCWFCAVSAERLSGVFERDVAGERIWKDLLGVLASRLGPGVGSGFLYWATDPLDNPDYERFCLDMYDATGIFPPTTTAFPLRDPARVRALLAMSEERGCWINRFSILSVKMLDRVHAEYDPVELAHVECLPLTRQAAFSFSNAGRFRANARKDPSLLEYSRDNLVHAPWYTGDDGYRSDEDYPLNSIGCVTGFIINMVDRRVQLVSPVTADDDWPDGMITFDEGTFDDAADLDGLLDSMMDRRMPPLVRGDDRPRFHAWLDYEEVADGFVLKGRFGQEARITEPARGDALRSLGRHVHDGRSSAAEIVTRIASERSIPAAAVQGDLDRVQAAGVLDDVPEPTRAR